MSERKAQFDAIYWRRQIDPRVLGMMGNYLIDEIQYASLKAIGRLTSGSGPSTSVDRAWYRGNNDLTFLGGAPNIVRLTITPHNKQSVTGLTIITIDLTLQPTGTQDNLDGMRTCKLVVYSQSGTGGTSGNLTLIDTFSVPLADRSYNVPGTDSAAGNSVTVSYTVQALSINIPAVVATLYNVNGQSDTNCFYPGASYAYGTALINNGLSFPVGITGGSGGVAGGGSNAGGGCLDPETPVLLRPDLLAPLRTLQPGSMVWTRPEDGGPLGFHRVEAVRHTTNLRCRVTFRDGRDFVSSINHLLNVRGLWRRADSLAPGEEVQGEPGGVVRSVDYLGEGPVVQLSIPTAGTYYGGNGIWQHNTLKQ